MYRNSLHDIEIVSEFRPLDGHRNFYIFQDYFPQWQTWHHAAPPGLRPALSGFPVNTTRHLCGGDPQRQRPAQPLHTPRPAWHQRQWTLEPWRWWSQEPFWWGQSQCLSKLARSAWLSTPRYRINETVCVHVTSHSQIFDPVWSGIQLLAIAINK